MEKTKWTLLVGCTLTFLMISTCSFALEKEISVWVETWSSGMHYGIDRAIAMFEQENPDIKVDKLLWKNSQLDKLIIAIVGGTAPDLVLVHGDTLKDLLRQSLNILEPLNEYLANSGLWDRLLPEVRQAVTCDGVEYGIPAIALYPLDGLTWNREVFAESGLSQLETDRAITWSDLAAMNGKLIEKDSNGRLLRTGYFPIEGRNCNLDVIETYFGIRAFEKGKSNLSSQGFIDALAFLNERFINVVGSSDVWNLGGPGWYKLGHGLTVVANLGSYGPQQLAEIAPDVEYGVTWHPTSSGEKRQQLGVWQLIMPHGATNKDSAWKFAEFMATSYDAMEAINKSTGFLGPSIEFLSQYQFDDPMMQWYIESIINADDLRISTLELNLPSAIDSFRNAARKVFMQEEPPEIALLKAQEEIEIEMLRMQ